MENSIEEAILTGRTRDPTLAALLDLAQVCIGGERHIFPNPLHEPILWRKFLKMVKTALESYEKVQDVMDKAVKEVTGEG